jgi:hypothetical protein
MKVTVSLADLPMAHPNLLWRDIRLAAISALVTDGRKNPFNLNLSVQEVPGFDDEILQMTIEPGKFRDADLARVRRTYEAARLIEFAAVAIAGLGLYHAGGHQIQDIGWRGTAADYLVDEEQYPIEIAGRSKRNDLKAAWRQKWRRLSANMGHDFFVCVVEFETPSGRLAFKE